MLIEALVDETLALPTTVTSIGLAFCVTGLVIKETLLKWSLD
jgi:ABC-type sulfate transport system permease component